MQYQLLNQRNYDFEELHIRKLQLLYVGDPEIKRYARMFIPKLNMETNNAYNDRLQWAVYTNYMANIVNNYITNLYSKPLTVVPATEDGADTPIGDIDKNSGGKIYQEFAKNADGGGNSLANILKLITRESMVTGKGYIGVDFPAPEEAVPDDLSVADAERLGINQPYTYHIPTLNVVDWSCDDFGRYNFVIIKTTEVKRESVEATPKAVIKFKVWKKLPVGVTWEDWEIETEIKKDGSIKEPKAEAECKLVAKGAVDFKEIPVLCLDMPAELSIGNLIGDKCASVYCRYTTLVSATARNLNPILVYQQGHEYTEPGRGGIKMSTLGSNPNRAQQAFKDAVNKGMTPTGPEDKIYWAEPEGNAYKIIQEQIEKDVDEMSRITHQQAQSLQAGIGAQGKSAVSKMMDHQERDMVLMAYGQLVKEFASKLYNLISNARGEDINWQPMGMADYKTVDRTQLLAEATQISAIAGQIGSTTWKKANMTRIALDYEPNLDPQTQQIIKDEIGKSVDALPPEQMIDTLKPQHVQVAETQAKFPKPQPGKPGSN